MGEALQEAGVAGDEGEGEGGEGVGVVLEGFGGYEGGFFACTALEERSPRVGLGWGTYRTRTGRRRSPARKPKRESFSFRAVMMRLGSPGSGAAVSARALPWPRSPSARSGGLRGGAASPGTALR